jgi:hypothetical protein
LERRLCQVGGVNQNYSSSSGTSYHIQIEDLGPVLDRVSEVEVRRVNTIVYANYGEPNARIVYGRDSDFPDLRTKEQNHFVEEKIQELAGEARRIIEEKELWLIRKIKHAIRQYYHTKEEAAKKEFEEANAHYPFLFSRAWLELKQEKGQVKAEPEPLPDEVVYPLEAGLRERVLDIERIIHELGADLKQLMAEGSADDILLQTCRKMVLRARETVAGRQPAEFTARRLDVTRNSLLTTWRQVRSRLKRA